MLDRLSMRQRTRSFITQAGVGELVAARNLHQVLETLLDYVVTDCQAQCGALFFGSDPPLSLRWGEWSQAGLRQLTKWEKAIGARLGNQPLRLDTTVTPTEYPLTNDPLRLLVNAPLLAGLQVVGCLTLGFEQTDALPLELTTLVMNAAANIGALGCLVNDLVTTSQKVVQLELFFQIGQSMVSTLDLNQLLVHTTGLAASILNAGAASLLLVDEARHELIFEVALGEKGPVLYHTRMPLDAGIAGWVATHGTPVIVNDVARDERHAWQFDVQTGFLTRSIICVPMQIKGKVIGVLEVLNKYSGAGFDHEDEQLLLTIAGQAAIAIENARLYESLREERDRTIRAQETARKELARSLHDGTVQLLAAMSMNIEHLERVMRQEPDSALEELDALRKLAHQATRQARLLLFELRPLILETRGLVAAMQTYVEQLSASETFQLSLELDPLPGRLNPLIERTAFSVLQEAVNNVKRHAQAQQVWIRLKLDQAALRLEVEDDGAGFRLADLHHEYDERGSLGLLNMRERAEMLNGKFRIESLSEGRTSGTKVMLSIPVTPDMWESTG